MAATKHPSSSSSSITRLESMLTDLAGNLWWSWDPQAPALWRRVDAKAYEASGHNAWRVVRKLSAARKRQLVGDPGFMAELSALHARYQAYLSRRPGVPGLGRLRHPGAIAYFCMEYGLHESLPLYAGGLGVLAGDHLKSASDLGLPLLAVGIYWHRGYTRQGISPTGAQTDRFPRLPVADAPVTEICTRPGKPLRVKLPIGSDIVTVRALCLNVGRVPLILLDTHLPENTPRHRKIVDVLYSGDRDARIRQEILLGIGGWRVLRALKIPIAACHLNEGHAAFLSLERIAERIRESKTSFAKACQAVRETTVFTTHTPIPAGNEEFDPALVDRYLDGYQQELGLTCEQFHDLARVKPGNRRESFGMTPLALRTSRYANGVAALHGEVARKMWKDLYPGKKLSQVPIGHVTNGIHLRTWLHPRMGELLDVTLGAGWEDRQDQARTYQPVAGIDDALLWELHQSLKRELVAFCRERVGRQLRGTGRAPRSANIDKILDPEALTLGFARRFAPYKRATLIFSDPRRLARLLNDPRRPVQIIFAGKAHPADTEGKALVQAVVNFARQPRFRNRVVFLDDYEMDVARHMVAGVDVWLNNPQRPREASGTSGMKPALHGGLNLSILDGWWPESCNGRNGWAIGKGHNYDGTAAADRRDAAELYKILEGSVIPAYYRRDRAGLPTDWIARMKNALQTVPVFFNSHRQVKEYFRKYYLPAMRKA